MDKHRRHEEDRAHALVSLKGQFLEVNDRFCGVLGYTPEEFRTFSVRDITHPQDRLQSLSILDRGLSYDREPVKVIKRYLHREGRTVWCILTTVLKRDDKGEPLHFSSQIEDITDRVNEDPLLRAFTHRFQEVGEFERQRIAREIHDELGQMFTAIRLEVHRLENDLGPEGEERTEAINALLDETMTCVRHITASLRPPILDDLGLESALAWMLNQLSERGHLEIDFQGPEKPLVLDWEIRIALFRIFQEALSNVLRHAQAKRLKVRLMAFNNLVRLSVEDDGVGIGDTSTHSFGVVGMKERAVLLGGRFTISRGPAGGTLLEVELPLPPSAVTPRVPREYWV